MARKQTVMITGVSSEIGRASLASHSIDFAPISLPKRRPIHPNKGLTIFTGAASVRNGVVAGEVIADPDYDWEAKLASRSSA